MAKILYVINREVEWLDSDGDEVEDFTSSPAHYFLDKSQAVAKAMELKEKALQECDDDMIVTYKLVEEKFSDVELQ